MLMSIAATMTLTGWSERTVWRRFAGHIVKNETSNRRSTIPFEAIAPHLCIALAPEDLPVLEQADAGDSDSQHAMALLFLSQGKPEGAIGWLELAAKHDDADAMNLLGICSVEGNGLPKDENLGIAWIAKAAALGHVISQRQMDFIHDRSETLNNLSSR
ncbi:tetratricopeptide repeat protein [Thiocystis violascens]|uniref:Sel1 repeat protein n=1 Tax=Thiocystis violascens (strain ATCC 17096 / DSM 198 / 6111) TaxID=765911 RepID=I3YBQ6_THIV6|nr:SEL1-like repeat protein [Thiocystis violascens]AFL74424.1 Sel1 repeat protein [Thiocystis violascens DSM 198]